MGLLGMASSAGLNSLAHSVTFGINLAIFTNLIQFMSSSMKQRGRSSAGPLYCVVIATVCIMADLVRHLINDSVNWSLVGKISEFKFNFDECEYPVTPVGTCKGAGVSGLFVNRQNALGWDLSMYNPDGSLSKIGWIFSIGGTWTGFVFLFVGVFWYADIGRKLRTQFARLRGDPITPAAESLISHNEAFLTPLSDAAP